MNTGIDYSLIGKMFICTIHGAVHYSWIALSMNSAKMNENSPWLVKNEFTLSMDS